MERKRLAVARALALRSPLVVADGFDEGAGGAEVRALAALIGEDRARMGGAALLVMADRALAADVADEVIDLGALLDRSGGEALDGRLGEYLRPDERERAAQL
jgi:ABC-type transporter Mla maintaining outer membrane lipid asymmetry ATPase subunit MlaF